MVLFSITIFLGDVAYVENMPIYMVYYTFPGMDKVRERFKDAKNDEG